MTDELNTVDNSNNLLSKKEEIKKPTRIDEIDKIIDKEASSILEELDAVGRDLDASIGILTDRVVQSTDASFPIALSRLADVRLEALKNKISVLKTLVADKGNEMALKKKPSGNSLDNILSGAAFGAALGAKFGNTQQGSIQTTVDVSEPKEFETVDVKDAEVIVETERINSENYVNSKDIDKLMNNK